MPVVELSTPAIVAANVVAWGAIHAGTGYLVHRLPVERLQRDGWLLRARQVERGGRRYERVGIRRWKDRLPEAGAVFAGGTSKRSIPGGRAGLDRFMVETRRAELGHWAAMACGPVAALWNPPLGAGLMVAYGVVVNAPFIAIQRYNRMRAARVRRRSTERSSTSTRDSRSAGDAAP